MFTGGWATCRSRLEPQKIVCRVVGAAERGVEAWARRGEVGVCAWAPREWLAGISVSMVKEEKGKGKELYADDPFADEGDAGELGRGAVGVSAC